MIEKIKAYLISKGFTDHGEYLRKNATQVIVDCFPMLYSNILTEVWFETLEELKDIFGDD